VSALARKQRDFRLKVERKRQVGSVLQHASAGGPPALPGNR
jgi:hypothetical protein